MTDAERLARYDKLGLTDKEKQELLAYDKTVDRDEKTEYDLTPEQQKIAKTFSRTGTRKVPTAYKLTKRERKPNATKGGIIAELAEFLEQHSQFSITDLAITNKERQIAFKIGADAFELTLVQKRKPK